mmetsp:Transcript_40802/g.53764  ORF Transcript_40802/g.53764 Transcript_40802/m.53764 type:complete len:163 (+) Transcript_40802:110-598(+)
MMEEVKDPEDIKINIFYAAVSNDLDNVRRYIDAGGDINKRDSVNDTPLHKACQGGKLEVAKYLVQHGSDPFLKNNKGEKPGERFALDVQEVTRQEIQRLIFEHTGVRVKGKTMKKAKVSNLANSAAAEADVESEKGFFSLFRCVLCMEKSRESSFAARSAQL